MKMLKLTDSISIDVDFLKTNVAIAELQEQYEGIVLVLRDGTTIRVDFDDLNDAKNSYSILINFLNSTFN